MRNIYPCTLNSYCKIARKMFIRLLASYHEVCHIASPSMWIHSKSESVSEIPVFIANSLTLNEVVIFIPWRLRVFFSLLLWAVHQQISNNQPSPPLTNLYASSQVMFSQQRSSLKALHCLPWSASFSLIFQRHPAHSYLVILFTVRFDMCSAPLSFVVLLQLHTGILFLLLRERLHLLLCFGKWFLSSFCGIADELRRVGGLSLLSSSRSELHRSLLAVLLFLCRLFSSSVLTFLQHQSVNSLLNTTKIASNSNWKCLAR